MKKLRLLGHKWKMNKKIKKKLKKLIIENVKNWKSEKVNNKIKIKKKLK